MSILNRELLGDRYCFEYTFLLSVQSSVQSTVSLVTGFVNADHPQWELNLEFEEKRSPSQTTHKYCPSSLWSVYSPV